MDRLFLPATLSAPASKPCAPAAGGPMLRPRPNTPLFRAPERKGQTTAEHLVAEGEFKFTSADDGKAGRVEGYGSIFSLMDRGGDIVVPGAFKASLVDWRRRKAKPPMLWQHDPSSPVGVWDTLEEDDRGLKAAGDLVMDVPQAQVARALMLAGAVKGLSIGYQVLDYDIDRKTGARLLKKIDLWEISLVTFPMMPEALISGVKADFDPKFWERAFRDEGLSNQDAKRAVSAARKLVLRDGGQPEQASRDGTRDLLLELRKAASAFSD